MSEDRWSECMTNGGICIEVLVDLVKLPIVTEKGHVNILHLSTTRKLNSGSNELSSHTSYTNEQQVSIKKLLKKTVSLEKQLIWRNYCICDLL